MDDDDDDVNGANGTTPYTWGSNSFAVGMTGGHKVSGDAAMLREVVESEESWSPRSKQRSSLASSAVTMLWSPSASEGDSLNSSSSSSSSSFPNAEK